jgi:hypothetical protein
MNKRFDQLPLNAAIPSVAWMGFFNEDTGTTERFDFSTLFVPSTEDFRWFGDVTYALGAVRTYGGKFWESQQNANLNHTPGTDIAWWIEVSKSSSGLVFWAAGIYVDAEAFVLYEINSVAYLFRLDPSEPRPFNSSNFTTELSAGTWQQVGEVRAIEVTTAGSTVTLPMSLLTKMRFIEDAPIAAPKTWAISGDDNAERIEIFRFSVTGLHAQTMPSNFFMETWKSEWDPATKIWTPSFAGRYQAELDYNKDTDEWYVKMFGPF